MANLWERLTHIFGHKFTSQFGVSAVDDNGGLTDTAATWATGLAGLTGEQLATGLRRCSECSEKEWPTLPMFKAKCTGPAVNEFGLDYIPEYHRPQPRPERDPRKLLSNSDRDERRRKNLGHVAAMKEKLGAAQEPEYVTVDHDYRAHVRDYGVMMVLGRLRSERPNIVDRLRLIGHLD